MKPTRPSAPAKKLTEDRRRLVVDVDETAYWQVKQAALDEKLTLRAYVLARLGVTEG